MTTQGTAADDPSHDGPPSSGGAPSGVPGAGPGVAAQPAEHASHYPADGSADPADPASPEHPLPALSVAGAARGLGVATATLRSWERRYGLAPSLHTSGGHRRYGPQDLARLAIMHRLVRQGVPPAEAARVAIREEVDANGASAAPAAAVPEAGDTEHPPAPGGGRVLAMPRRPPSARGLARAAMALDAVSCRATVSTSLADRGTVTTWDELIRPVLAAIGDRWAATGEGVEVEHSFSVVVAAALASHAARLGQARNVTPALLASVPEDLHDLPLLALNAALSDVGIRGHVIGARTPEPALAEAATRLGPPVVFLWAQMPTASVPRIPPMRPAPVLVLGGPGWRGTAAGSGIRTADLPDAVAAVRAAMGL